MQLKVLNADGGDDVTLAPGVARAVREDDLVVALAAPQQTQVLREKEQRKRRGRDSSDQDACKPALLIYL